MAMIMTSKTTSSEISHCDLMVMDIHAMRMVVSRSISPLHLHQPLHQFLHQQHISGVTCLPTSGALMLTGLQWYVFHGSSCPALGIEMKDNFVSDKKHGLDKRMVRKETKCFLRAMKGSFENE